MKIRDFFSTLNFSISILNDRNNEDVRNFEDNFDDIMRNSIEYIRRLAEDNAEALSDEYDIDDLVLDDYDYISNETFQNTDIHPIAMKYVASKYLNSHRDIIPDLEREIEERGLVFCEEESYTDDFHENLLTALLSLKHDYKENYGTLLEELPEEVSSILRVGTDPGEKDAAFRTLHNKFGSATMAPYALRRNVMMMGYYSLYGLQGLDDKTAPQSTLKIKNAFHIKDYIQSYVDRLEPVFKNEIVNSILSIVYQLDRFGEIYEKIESHNDRMNRYGLPGLGYQSDEKEIYPNLPRFEQLMTEELLMKQNVEDLLILNVFYNNRFAKVMNEYALSLFVIGNLDRTQRYVDGEELTVSRLSKSTLNVLITKYQTLILPVKQYFIEEQSKISSNPYVFIEDATELELDSSSEESRTKKRIELNPNAFVKRMTKAWRNDYRDYYNSRLPGITHNLEDDLLFTNILYNPIFLSYNFKYDSVKAAYAYLNYLSNEEPDRSLNYGVVLDKDNLNNGVNVLLAFDGNLDSTVKAHVKKQAFEDFLVAQTGSLDARVFVGFDDFFIAGEFATSQLVAPQCRQREKFIKGLRNGSAVKENPSARITPVNEKFLNHLEYNVNKTKFMPAHKVVMTTRNRKGKLVQDSVQPVIKCNMKTMKRYIRNYEGEFIDENEFYSQKDSQEIEV